MEYLSIPHGLSKFIYNLRHQLQKEGKVVWGSSDFLIDEDNSLLTIFIHMGKNIVDLLA